MTKSHNQSKKVKPSKRQPISQPKPNPQSTRKMFQKINLPIFGKDTKDVEEKLFILDSYRESKNIADTIENLYDYIKTLREYTLRWYMKTNA